MGLLTFRLRTERRTVARRIGAVLLIALAAGAALLAAQAARRTETAFTRNLDAGHASNAAVAADAYTLSTKQSRAMRTQGARMLDAVDRSPLVVAHGRFGGMWLYRVQNGKIDERLNTGSAFGLAAYDDAVGRTISSLRMHAGRLADPGRADEMTISKSAAAITGWRVGTRVTDLRVFNSDDIAPETGNPRAGRGSPANLVVVGIGDLPEELMQASTERLPRVFLTPAFVRQHPDSVFYLNDVVRLRRGSADMPALRAFVADVNRTAPNISMPISPTDDGLRKATNANGPVVNGLWIIAALAALVGIMLTAQSLGQSLATRSDDHAQLRALGATRRQRVSLEVGTLVIVGLAAGLVAGVLCYLLSPVTPIGAARDVEPHPGFSLNLALTATAVGLTLAGTVIAALPALWRLVNQRWLPGPGATDSGERKSRVADFASRAGFGVPAVVGTRFAFQTGRGRSATPVRSVLASLTLVVAAVTGTLAFGANVGHWTSTPHLYGWNWDAAVGSGFGAVPPEGVQALAHFDNVTETGALVVGRMTVGGRAVPTIGVDRTVGPLAPEMDAGRYPENAAEIALGARTMRDLHTHIGGHITATIQEKVVDLEVVGRTTLPSFGNARFGETGLGTGALGTASRFPIHDENEPTGRYNYVLLRFKPGKAEASAVKLRAFLAGIGCSDASCVLTDSRPPEINGYRNAKNLPVAIGVVLALFLVVTLVHALVSTMRRRTSDLAVLRALGCTRRQLAATLRWQGLMLTLSAIVIGIPIGLIATRFAWSAFASHVGIASDTTSPVAILFAGGLSLVLITLIVATAVGGRVPTALRRYRVTN
ncbi:MAG: putative transport system permease protein [Actinomycetota bacterium]|nr:putative transport system permease protein [Actinomycetota bacterium]